METVYGDLLFMINFSMDFLCFFLTAKLMHRRVGVLRFTVASGFGAIYAVWALFITAYQPLALLVDILVCFVMCLVAFAPKEVKIGEALLLTSVYTAISMMLGGIMTALFNLLNRTELGLDEVSDDGLSGWLFAALALVSGAAALIWGRFFRGSTSKRSARLKIMLDGKSVELDALCDSGNLLTDPISGRRVIVVERGALEPLFTPEIAECLRGGGYSSLESLDDGMRRRIRLIPSKSAHASGILSAIMPDSISVTTEKGSHNVDALIAPVDSNGGFDSYGALLPTELLV